jgi:hypothetical protein
MQGASQKAQAERFNTLQVRLGVAGPPLITKACGFVPKADDWKDRVVAKVIEFYIPINFQWRTKWIPVHQRGKVIEFGLPAKKSA